MTENVINIAGYQFVSLENLPERRAHLRQLSDSLGLKGTILLSPEGINFFVAGTRDSLDSLLRELRSWPGLSTLTVKESPGTYQPFRRMLVRIKKEIIAFGVEGIAPGERTSPKLSPEELKRWLDEGRPLTLLDTRNDYEVNLGTFHGAKAIGVHHFRDFPAAVDRLPDSLKNETIVMFCTGGIRCEKAGPYMERVGFQNVFQLDGGILNYFEKCGQSHYDGECFVFDQRVGVDATLEETESSVCYACLRPLTAEEQRDSRTVAGASCPHCFVPTSNHAEDLRDVRQTAIRAMAEDLPGFKPYDLFLPMNIPLAADGRPLPEALAHIYRSISVEEWQQKCENGFVLDGNEQPAEATRRVRSGERYFHKIPQTREPWVNGAVEVLFEDEDLIVVNKPAPLPMHPGGRFNRNTLQYILRETFKPWHPRAAHRLDANTSGVVVLTHARKTAAHIENQI